MTTGGGAEGRARSLAGHLEPVGGLKAATWAPWPPPRLTLPGPFPAWPGVCARGGETALRVTFLLHMLKGRAEIYWQTKYPEFDASLAVLG